MNDKENKKSARVFFALWPDDAARAALASWQGPLKKLCGGKATPVERLHNTLLFLGDVEVERLEALQLAAQEVGDEAFQLVLDSARYWGHNHIVYAAPHIMPRKLSDLVSKLQQAMLRHQFQFDQRGYQPHVTLLRHAHGTDTPLPEMKAVVWKIREFVLMQSVSEGQGVRYEMLSRFNLST